MLMRFALQTMQVVLLSGTMSSFVTDVSASLSQVGTIDTAGKW